MCVLEPSREHGTCGRLTLRADSCYVMLNARACGAEAADADADADSFDSSDGSSRTEDLPSDLPSGD
jgi:hypothetical protein